ncbi:hypothetical protein PIB30_028069 [Stylosanthes scabra]|uniref:Reverse transcriptase zinc-binding domain-containing protein n=1 Tax=Stylosanthes scabra TaxID=79078 RepID=A0ABU6RB68_9FABA|nr:hypothetical protein [Stylosanthes scabra]
MAGEVQVSLANECLLALDLKTKDFGKDQDVNLPFPDICPRCHQGVEDTFHYFFSCSKAFRVWQLIGLGTSQIQGYHDFLNLIRACCASDGPIFVATLWWIWRDRNNDVHVFCPLEPWKVEKVLGFCRSSSRDFSLFYYVQQYTVDPHLRLIICETDSLDAFNLVNLDLSLVMDHRDLVSQIKDVELWPWSLQIKLIQRSANNAADLMAKHAASSQLVFREWPSPSSDLLLVIQQDLAS